MATVLIIDDSPTEVHIMQEALRRNGYDTLCAADGESGLEMARLHRPGLIFMDVVMPGMNGFQATRMLARAPETASIPVVMITTKGEETDRIWGLRQGAVDYLVKPVGEAALVGKAREWLDAGST